MDYSDVAGTGKDAPDKNRPKKRRGLRGMAMPAMKFRKSKREHLGTITPGNSIA